MFQWYVVNTFSGYENSVKKALEDRIKNAGLEEQFGEILIPSEKVTTRSGKKTVQKTNKLLPGYIFISMDLTKASWHLVQNTPKVTGFLGGQNPKPVRKAEMNRMLGQAPPDEQAPVEKEKLKKQKSPWWNLVQVASKAKGNEIGSITDLQTSCMAAGQPELADRDHSG